MKRIVRYKAIDPYYSDVEQTYIGATLNEVDEIQFETERHMGQHHANGIMSIYKTEIISES